MVNEAHAPWRDRTLADILSGCGGIAGKAELLTGIEGTSSRPVQDGPGRRLGGATDDAATARDQCGVAQARRCRRAKPRQARPTASSVTVPGSGTRLVKIRVPSPTAAA
jgi:hypothetical protein